jgi:hypothetical protein
MHETPEGYLVCVGVPIARTGEMVYGEGETPLEVDGEGRVVIDRTAEEVFRPETIASFEGKAVTITHPKEFVGPQNWSTLAKGVLQNVRRGEGEQETDLIADLLITDGMAIALVKNGLREVSCGYEAEYIQTEEGRGIQTKIIGNHLALVHKGRAGSSYAINDHIGKGATQMKLSEKIKAIFAKAQDEALKVASDEAGEEHKEGDKDKSKDESKGAGYDELVKCVKDLGEKVAALSKPKDEMPQKKKGEKEEAGDEEVAPSLEERLKILEASVQKLLEREAKEDEVPVDEEEVGDEDLEEAEADAEAEDDGDVEEAVLTGDSASETASRVEILAPGLKATKDVKAKALKAAYATKDGKRIIEAVNGGKAPTYDSKEKVDMLFIAASELMKHSRSSDFSKTKQTRDYQSTLGERQGAMTAEQMNEINAKHYKRA